ncbi:MAG: filamentous hemagglutinin N-terminal domain-containing protein [Rhabdochlamydiaceae bacterium]|nr:filamentous hemagglutinin N-terminal domain-containing protein [Rhabdochlamydiaceae bacterium]
MPQLKKKSSLYFFVSLTCFTWASSFCFSLPSEPIAQSGTVEVEYPNAHTMVIKPSDGAILHYEDFQVGPKEEVRFIQNASSSAQHRVTGENPSQILGSIQSKGQVTFLSISGIHFGSDSKVDAGSLTLSTLDITNEEQSHFSLRAGRNSSIVNEGSLRSEKGSIVLLAPHICNLGSIEACDVSLGSGEHVTLDGANLSVKGSTKESLIEQLGNIKSSTVSIKLALDTKSIEETGVTHKLVVEENGVVTFGAVSQIKTQKLLVEGSQISIRGSIDSTNSLDKGGVVHLFGKDILLQGSKIDSSGLIGGGEVLIGGEFQGKGTTPYASKVLMDGSSEIYCNAIEKGDGGLVVLWSQDQTLFEGKIFAQGGALEGNGGLVETSSQGGLDVEKGDVNTVAIHGKIGEWLLDPTYMWIENGDTFAYGYGDCTYTGVDGNGHVTVNKFLNLSSSVTVKAAWGIYLQNSVSVTGSSPSVKPSLTLDVCSSLSFIQVGYGSDNEVNVTTDGGDFTCTLPSNLVWLKTLSMKIKTNGGNVTLPNVGPYNSTDPALTIDAGSGSVSFSAPYSDGRLGAVTVIAGSVNTSNIDIHGDLNMTSAPLYLSGNASINTNGHNMYLGTIDGKSGSSSSVSLAAGASNTITVGAVGSSVALSSFNIGSGGASSLTFSNVTTINNISIAPSTTLSGSLTSTNGSVTLGSALILSGNSTVKAATGITVGAQIQSNAGASYSLTLDSSSAGNISLSGDVSNLSSFSITNAASASLFDIQLSSAGAINIACPVLIQKGGGGISSGSGDITLSKSINPKDLTSDNNVDLTINTGGKISVQGMGNDLYSFGNIKVTGSTISLGSSVSATGSVTFSTAVNITSSTTVKGVNGITIPGAITTNSSARPTLTLDAAAHSLSIGSLGTSSYPFGTVNIVASSLALGGDVLTASVSGATQPSVTISCPITISSNTKIQGPDGIILKGAVNANTAAPNLTLDAGSSPLSVASLGSKDNLLGTLSLTGSSLSIGGDIATNRSISFASPITLTANATLQGDTGISLSGALSSGTSSSLVLTSSGPISVVSLGADTQALGSISVSGTEFTATGDLISSGSVTLTGTTITLGSKISATTSVYIANTGPLTIASGSMNLSGDFTQTGTGAVSLAASIVTPGSISFTGPLSILGTTTLQGSKGLTLPVSVTANSPNCNLTLNAGSNSLKIKSLGSEAMPFGSLSITASTIDLGGDMYSSSSIKIDSPITISTDSKIASADVNGLTLTKPVTVAAGSLAPTLTLDATSAGAVDIKSLGSSTAPLGAVSLIGNHVYLSGDIASNALVAISGPVTLYTAIVVIGDAGITLDQDLSPSADPVDLTLQASNGTVSITNLGTDTSPLRNITIKSSGPIGSGNLICTGGVDLSGTTITLGSNVTASSYVKIANSDLLTIPSGTLNLTQDFIQSGTGAVSLGASIATPGLITFTGALTITGDTTLQGSTGITISGAIAPGSIAPGSEGPLLTLNAGTTPLTVNFLSNESNSFGSVTVSASTLTLGGDVYASSAIKISPPIMLSANTTLNSLQGTGGITLLKAVTPAAGSGAPTLTLHAAGGAADVNSLGSSDAPLGAVSLKGSSVFLSGDVTSNAFLSISGPIYLLNDNSISLTGDTGITLDNNLVPNAGLCDLIMQSIAVVKTQDLGNSSYPLNDVSLTVASIELQGTITANSLEINCETCASGNCPPGIYSSCPESNSQKQSR